MAYLGGKISGGKHHMNLAKKMAKTHVVLSHPKGTRAPNATTGKLGKNVGAKMPRPNSKTGTRSAY